MISLSEFLNDPPFTAEVVPNNADLPVISDLGDDPKDYAVSVAVTVRNTSGNISHIPKVLALDSKLKREELKNWSFSAYHNYEGHSKSATDPDCFLSVSLTYTNEDSHPPCRFVMIQVEFSGDADHSHTYYSLPMFYNTSGTCHTFNEVLSISVLSTFFSASNEITFTIRVLPAKLSSFSIDTRFLLAARCNNVPLLNQYLTAGCNINATSDFFSQVDGNYLDGATALIIAATDHSNDVVSVLLKNGADVLHRNRNGESALHRACWSGNEAIISQLIEFGALIDDPNFTGLTPMMVAALAGHEKIVEYFMEAGVNVDRQDYDGNTAAHFAASQNRSGILRILMDHKCSLKLINYENHTPIDYCTESRITCFILTGGKISSLGKPVAPFTCPVPFQLPSALLPLFMIGLNVMRHVAYGIGVYPVYPFCMLQSCEQLVLLKRVYECVVQHRGPRLEVNVLTESLYFACFYVLSRGLSNNGKDKMKQSELSLRKLIVQAYEDLYHSNLTEKGVLLDSAQSSVFLSILDLLLLSCFDKYAIKRSFFLQRDKLLTLHSPSTSYPALPEGYFASLPMTRDDETALHTILQKKQLIVPSVENSAHKEVLAAIVGSITPKNTRKPSATSLSVDYGALQQQIQLLSEREIVPYKVRFLESMKLPDSNIYGHQMAVVDELETEEFKKFWASLSKAEKQSILTVSEKELNQQIKESVYWFSLRYALENYNGTFSEDNCMGVKRSSDSFYILEDYITNDTLPKLIDYASTYDSCVMPITPFSKQSQLFNEPGCEAIHAYQKPSEEIVIYYCILRFNMFLYWMFCDHVDQAFQMHKKEEEANREAAMLLKEAVDKEEKKKGRKKKKSKGKTEPAKPAASEINPTKAKNPPLETKATDITTDSIDSKPTQINNPEQVVESTSQTNPSNLNQEKGAGITKPSDTGSPAPVLFKRRDRPSQPLPEALRINRFLLGERRSDVIVVEKKREKEEVQKPEYLSLRKVFLRSDPLEAILRDADTLDPSESIFATNSLLPVSTS